MTTNGTFRRRFQSPVGPPSPQGAVAVAVAAVDGVVAVAEDAVAVAVAVATPVDVVGADSAWLACAVPSTQAQRKLSLLLPSFW